MAQVDVLLDELRPRVGQTFTLAELAGAYRDATAGCPRCSSARRARARRDARARRGRGVPPLRSRRDRLHAVSRPPPTEDAPRPVGCPGCRAAGLAVVFAVGIALGQALDDSSAPSGTQTSVRTLAPATPSSQTVTVTVTTTGVWKSLERKQQLWVDSS